MNSRSRAIWGGTKCRKGIQQKQKLTTGIKSKSQKRTNAKPYTVVPKQKANSEVALNRSGETLTRLDPPSDWSEKEALK